MDIKRRVGRMKTYVIHGLFTRNPSGRNTREQYAHVNLVYNTDDSVSWEDIDFYMSKLNVKRTVPIDIRTGEKLDYVIGLDKDRRDEGNRIPLNRLAFKKSLERDLKNLDWV